ncbi:hypothetical protein [Arenicella sp. 4NH20-0111]
MNFPNRLERVRSTYMVDSANDPMDIFNLWRMSAFMFLGVSVQPETWSD